MSEVRSSRVSRNCARWLSLWSSELVQGSGLSVEGLWFGIQGSGFQGSGLGVQVPVFMVYDSWFRVQGSGSGLRLEA